MQPSNILDSIRMQHGPDATEKAVFESFLARIEQDREAFREVAHHWFKEHYKRSTVVAVSANEYEVRPVAPPIRSAPSRSASDSVSVTPSRERAAPRSPEVRQREKTQIETWKEQIRYALSMTFIMPNGDQLQHCNAGYVRQCGGVFTAIAKGLADNVLLGANRTNEDLQNICKRYRMEPA